MACSGWTSVASERAIGGPALLIYRAIVPNLSAEADSDCECPSVVTPEDFSKGFRHE